MDENNGFKRMTLHEKVNYLLEENEALEDKYLRIGADFQNYKRNKELEFERVRKTASKDTILAMLEFYDTLVLSLRYDDYSGNSYALLTKFKDCLKHAGAEMYCEPGDSFDPDIHEAYSLEKNSQYEPGTIAKVMKQGCRLNGEIIRHAIVSVAGE